MNPPTPPTSAPPGPHGIGPAVRLHYRKGIGSYETLCGAPEKSLTDSPRLVDCPNCRARMKEEGINV